MKHLSNELQVVFSSNEGYTVEYSNLMLIEKSLPVQDEEYFQNFMQKIKSFYLCQVFTANNEERACIREIFSTVIYGNPKKRQLTNFCFQTFSVQNKDSLFLLTNALSGGAGSAGPCLDAHIQLIFFDSQKFTNLIPLQSKYTEKNCNKF